MKNTLKRKITEEGSTNKKGNKFETCQTSIEFKKIAVTFFLFFFNAVIGHINRAVRSTGFSVKLMTHLNLLFGPQKCGRNRDLYSQSSSHPR